MKKTIYLLAFIILASCGSSKTVVDNKTPQNKSKSGTGFNGNDLAGLTLEEFIKFYNRSDDKRKASLMSNLDQRIQQNIESKNMDLAKSLQKFKEKVLASTAETATEAFPEEAETAIVEELATTKKGIKGFHNSFNAILQRYVSDEGNVNYKDLKEDKASLNLYLDILGNNVPTETSSREDKLAFWINAYNAYTLKLIIDNYPTESIKDIKKPWDKEFITLAGKTYSLNNIEHDILRKMDEPRIHFAINCASFSCPKLLNEAYTGVTLEEQLTAATKGFLKDEKRNSIAADKVEVSKIFKWFGKDFKKDGDLISFLNKYSDIEISEKAKVSYKKYDWNLNE